MKSNFILLFLTFMLGACSSTKNLTYKGRPVISATSTYSEYRIGSDWYKGHWSIAPHIENDTLKVLCYNSKESFEFRTDDDQIEFDIEPGTTKSFYVRMAESTYAHTIIEGIAFQSDQLNFDLTKNSRYSIKYQTEKSEYLEDLKEMFPVDLNSNKMSDTEVVLAVLNWTDSRWEHNGNNSPSKNDAITILKEAKEGQQFPCFAYAIVLRDQLSALSYRARTVYLKTQDAKNSARPPGHVATEVYLNDLEKWVLVDGQFNVMPFLDDIPLNSVEFQDAIGNYYGKFELRSLSEEIITKKEYVDFIYDYLYYFDTTLDNRYEKDERHLVDDKRSIMLVPLGAEPLTHIDFWDMDVDYCVYTNSINDFYAQPN